MDSRTPRFHPFFAPRGAVSKCEGRAGDVPNYKQAVLLAKKTVPPPPALLPGGPPFCEPSRACAVT